MIAGCGKKEAPVQQAEENNFFFKVQFALGDVKISGAAGEKAAAAATLFAAGAAHAHAAPFLGAGQADVVAQEVHQQAVGGHLALPGRAVYVQ